MMRYLLFCLACLPAASMAQTTADKTHQEKFEQRFRAADKNGDGRLSREEAYAAFPNAPKFFGEIDADYDNYLTLAEVAAARAKRVDRALDASSVGSAAKYVRPEYLKPGRAPGAGEANAPDMMSSIANRRSNEFYEFLGWDNDNDPYPDPPVADSASNLVNKPF